MGTDQRNQEAHSGQSSPILAIKSREIKMTNIELETLEEILQREVIRRNNLGGYSMEAEGLLTLTKAALAIVQHLISETKNGHADRTASTQGTQERRR